MRYKIDLKEVKTEFELKPFSSDEHPWWDWQQRNYYILKNTPYCIIKAPTGSGKSSLICYSSCDRIIGSGYTRKSIILVPQKGISQGFSGPRTFTLPDYGKVSWHITTNNFCNLKSESKIKGLKKFLLSDIGHLQDITYNNNFEPSRFVSICTHVSFVGVWKTLTKSEKIKILTNLDLWLDECHHVQSSDRASLDEQIELGKILDEILALSFDNRLFFQICLTTATLFRGDGHTIISEKFMNKFCLSDVELEEHLRNINIEYFSYEYVKFKNYEDELKLVSERIKPSEKNLIIIPSRGDGERYIENDTMVEDLINVCSVKRDKILDLVSLKNRDKKLEELKKYPEKYDLVIACGLFVEGHDWPPCKNVHILNIGKSMVKIVQIQGRCMRKYEYVINKILHKKSSVNLFLYIKNLNFSNMELKEKFREHLLILQTALIIDGMLRPIKIPRINFNKSSKEKQFVSLENLLWKYGNYQSLFIDLMLEYERSGPDRNLRDVAQIVSNNYYPIYKEDILKEDLTAGLIFLLKNVIPDIALNKDTNSERKTGPIKIDANYFKDCSIAFFKDNQESLFQADISIEDLRKLREFHKNNSEKLKEYIKIVDFDDIENIKDTYTKPSKIGFWVSFEYRGKKRFGRVEEEDNTKYKIRYYPKFEFDTRESKIILVETGKGGNKKCYLREGKNWIIKTRVGPPYITKKDKDISKIIELPNSYKYFHIFNENILPN